MARALQTRLVGGWLAVFNETVENRKRGCTKFCVMHCGTAILAVFLHGLEARATKFRTVPRKRLKSVWHAIGRGLAPAATFGIVWTCLAVTAFCTTAVAGDGWPYWWRYCGYNYPSTYVHDYVPYYAQHPPVYYSYPVARPYGYSPYAYPPGYPTPEVYAPSPALTRNPYVAIRAAAAAVPEREMEEPRPLRIINPYVEQPAGAREASLGPRPQVVYPAALEKTEKTQGPGAVGSTTHLPLRKPAVFGTLPVGSAPAE